MKLHLDFGRSKNLHDSIDTATVSFPHRSEPRLASEVPALRMSALSRHIDACRAHQDNIPFERDMSLLDALHVEAYSRY